MTTPAKVSYAFIAALLVLLAVLHLATPFITVLFSYFALSRLRFGRGKWLAVTLFLLLVAALSAGFHHFLKRAYVAVPKIANTTIPKVIDYAEKHGFELPFSDYDSLKALARENITEQLAGVGRYAKEALVKLAAFLIGIVVAISLFLDARFQLEPEAQGAQDSLYWHTWTEIAARFKTFYESFATVMGAQIIISVINTGVTAIFLLWNHIPYTTVLLGLTFLFGLVPIIGNLMSNTLIVAVAFTLEPKLALLALVFLIALHKLEYFLNSKIIGHRIRNPMWLTLLGLVIGEKLMGVPGMILAPVVLHYIKVEASRNKVARPPIETLPPLESP